MSETVARMAAARARDHLVAAGARSAEFVFHGGEPLLGGVPHLRMLTSVLDDALRDTGIQVSIGMQSNGLLLSEEIAQFLVDNQITIGISLDGPKATNDLHRRDHRGNGSYDTLSAALQLIRSPRFSSVFSGFLCVVIPDSDPIATLDHLCSFSPPSIDFLLPLRNHDSLPSHDIPDARTPYADWLIAVFDEWWRRGQPVEIRYFNSILNLLCDAPSSVETIGLEPVGLVVVETNGDIEAVDTLRTTRTGATWLELNVFANSFDEAARSRSVRSRQMGSVALCAECRRCPLVSVCGGGYLPHRYSSARAFDNPSVYCADLKRIIVHIYETLIQSITNAGVSGIR